LSRVEAVTAHLSPLLAKGIFVAEEAVADSALTGVDDIGDQVDTNADEVIEGKSPCLHDSVNIESQGQSDDQNTGDQGTNDDINVLYDITNGDASCDSTVYLEPDVLWQPTTSGSALDVADVTTERIVLH
jgi:hypothetical protein